MYSISCTSVVNKVLTVIKSVSMSFCQANKNICSMSFMTAVKTKVPLISTEYCFAGSVTYETTQLPTHASYVQTASNLIDRERFITIEYILVGLCSILYVVRACAAYQLYAKLFMLLTNGNLEAHLAPSHLFRGFLSYAAVERNKKDLTEIDPSNAADFVFLFFLVNFITIYIKKTYVLHSKTWTGAKST